MSREYFPIWKIHLLIKILSLFQGNTLMIGDKYVLLFDNDLHIAYSEYRKSLLHCSLNVYVTYGYGLDANVKAQT
jgi:hypothetical protein